MKKNLNKLLPEKIASELAARPSLVLFSKALYFLLSERFIRIIIGLITHTLVARYLGAEKYGLYGYAYNFFFLFVPFVDFGSSEFFVNEILKGNKDIGTIKGTVLLFKGLSAFFAYLLLGISIVLVRGEDPLVVKLVLIFGLANFLNAFNILEVFFQSQMRMKHFARSRNISYVFTSILKLVAIHLSWEVDAFVWIFVIEYLLQKITLYYFYDKKNYQWSVSKTYLKDIFLNTWPLFITSFVIICNQRLGVFFLNKFSSVERVGNYTVALTLLQMWDFVPMAICTAIFPKIIQTKKNSFDAYNSQLYGFYSSILWFGIVFAIGVNFSSHFLVNILYADKYPLAPITLEWGSVMSIFIFINYARFRWFTIEGILKKWMILMTGSLALNLIAQPYFAQKYFEKGTIGASILGFVGFNMFYAIFDKDIRLNLKHIMISFIYPLKMIKRFF